MTKAKSKRGKPVNLYLRDGDVVKVRELMASVASQGERTSESLIVRAAIRAANPGRAFLEAYREAASEDLRFTRD
jgi:hypothetical protein